ncbi:hypothetical protein ACFIOY_39845 [Bradyrhizobium sp. TZ2]
MATLLDGLRFLFTVILGLILSCSQTILSVQRALDEYILVKTICAIALLLASPAVAESPYPKPTNDGRERIQRIGACPTGYVGKGGFREALHNHTPRAVPKIKGAARPCGYFASADACKAFR